MKVDRDRLSLVQIVDAAEAILEFTRGGRDAFLESRLIRDAVIRNLAVIGEATKRLSEGLRTSNPNVPWRDIAGLRDFVIHRYEWVDNEEIWRIVERDIPPLVESCRRILAQHR